MENDGCRGAQQKSVGTISRSFEQQSYLKGENTMHHVITCRDERTNNSEQMRSNDDRVSLNPNPALFDPVPSEEMRTSSLFCFIFPFVLFQLRPYPFLFLTYGNGVGS